MQFDWIQEDVITDLESADRLITLFQLRPQANNMYCLCSNKSFDEIFELQEANPVSPDVMIALYTNCLDGCGSCVKALKAEAEMRELISQPISQN